MEKNTKIKISFKRLLTDIINFKLLMQNVRRLLQIGIFHTKT